MGVQENLCVIYIVYNNIFINVDHVGVASFPAVSGDPPEHATERAANSLRTYTIRLRNHNNINLLILY